MPLVKGDTYTKREVGFRKPEYKQSTVERNGEKYFFLTLNDKYNNEMRNGELIVHHRSQSQVVQQNTPQAGVCHVFVRDSPNQKRYTYMGEVDQIKPFDQERNVFTFR